MYIDSHIHLWQYDAARDSWITDEMGVLKSSFGIDDLSNATVGTPINGVVVVQADQSENETQYLLDYSYGSSLILGVVGWVDLCDHSVEDSLNAFTHYKKLKGYRHILQGENSGFMLQNEFIAGVKKLHEYAYTYDILVYAHQLDETIQFINKLPEQKLILDHMAKPNIKDKELSQWKKAMSEIAINFPHVKCKLSGLLTEADWTSWHEEDLLPYIDFVFQNFGVDRILYGSDWPVVLLAGTYKKWYTFIDTYLNQLSIADKTKVLSTNATLFYNL